MRATILKSVFTALLAVLTSTVSAQGDLATFDLKGKVSSCTYKNKYGTKTYVFNTAGRWLRYNGKSLAAGSITVKRNAKGKLLSYTKENVDEFTSDTYTYKYNTAGQVISVNYSSQLDQSVTTFKYDSKGHVIKEIEKGTYGEEEGYDGSQSFTSITSYTYLASDAKGNWTKRKATQDGESWIETRTIKYHQ